MLLSPLSLHAFTAGATSQDPAGPAERLAAALGLDVTPIALHRFPDGESLVTATGAGRTAILFRSLDNPNAKLIETLFAAAALRRQGAEKLILAAPYFSYMRQDKEFTPGQAVSAAIVGQWIGEAFDAVVTVAPHLHRIARLDDVVTSPVALALDPGALMADGLPRDGGGKMFVLGPDEESEPLVRSFAARLGAPFAVARKVRHGDRAVDVTLSPQALANARVILIDDMISTGETLAACARQARAAGATKIDAVTAHVVGPADPTPVLRAAGIDRLYSCDTLAHDSNRFETAPLIAEALKSLIG
jgi:ribose-phosphate pyrophosphokinase